MGATEGRSQMCHWSKVMKRLLAPCSHPYLLVSEGLFEKQDKYSPSPWQIFFILVTIMTFIAPRNAADALRRRGIAVHCREQGVLPQLSKLRSTRARRQQGSASRLTVLQRALPFFFLYVLRFCTFALRVVQQVNPLRTVQHVKDPICLSDWAEWGEGA